MSIVALRVVEGEHLLELISVSSCVNSWDAERLEGFGHFKKSNDLIWICTSDLPGCNIQGAAS
jgi:hypothetical protein